MKRNIRKLIGIALILSLLLLAGCGSKDKNTESTTEGGDPALFETLTLDDLEIYGSTEDAPETTEALPKATLAVLEVARFGGPYVEDGSDETVENVACILVENTTEQYVDYGVIQATVGGRQCSFTVTGLPGGRAAWVMEENRTPVEGDGAYSYEGETISPLRDAVTADERVTVELLEGEIKITNVSQKELTSVRLYYKQLHTDGNYLGGITYTVAAEGLQAGESKTLTAGHCLPEKCGIVRLDVVE